MRKTMEHAFDGGDDEYAMNQQRYAARVQPSVTSTPTVPQQHAGPAQHRSAPVGGSGHAPAARAAVAVAQPAKPAQGPQQELDLEIPAFLRRQAS